MTKVHIRTYGCSINQSDSERMAGLLAKAGFKIVPTVTEADVVILNTCTVKAPTENKFFNYLNKLKEAKEHIIVAGCLPQVDPHKVQGYSLIGPSQIHNIVQVVEETVNGNEIVMLVPEDENKLVLPRIRKNRIIEVVPIARGCLGSCTYCIVKKARGNLKSYSKEDIIGQTKLAVQRGAKEIWLTAQDTACWGYDIGDKLPNLIEKLIKIPGDFKIRIGMGNPNFFKDYIEELLPFFESNKLFKFLHIPVQAGNNDVLMKMDRKYSVEDYKDIIQKVKTAYPDMTIATDMICGFPGETKEQFQESLDLIKETKPEVVNISRYWDRDGTPSSTMEDKIHTKETKERSRKMASLFEWQSFEQNKKLVGWKGEILIEDEGKEGTSIGRNDSYKQIILNGKYPIGSHVEVEVVKAAKHYLIAKEIMHSTQIIVD